MAKKGTIATRVSGTEEQVLIMEVERMEQMAHRLGLHVTARALNQAKNVLGWEIAGDILQAGRARRGQRPKE